MEEELSHWADDFPDDLPEFPLDDLFDQYMSSMDQTYSSGELSLSQSASFPIDESQEPIISLPERSQGNQHDTFADQSSLPQGYKQDLQDPMPRGRRSSAESHNAVAPQQSIPQPDLQSHNLAPLLSNKSGTASLGLSPSLDIGNLLDFDQPLFLPANTSHPNAPFTNVPPPMSISQQQLPPALPNMPMSMAPQAGPGPMGFSPAMPRGSNVGQQQFDRTQLHQDQFADYVNSLLNGGLAMPPDPSGNPPPPLTPVFNFPGREMILNSMPQQQYSGVTDQPVVFGGALDASMPLITPPAYDPEYGVGGSRNLSYTDADFRTGAASSGAHSGGAHSGTSHQNQAGSGQLDARYHVEVDDEDLDDVNNGSGKGQPGKSSRQRELNKQAQHRYRQKKRQNMEETVKAAEQLAEKASDFQQLNETIENVNAKNLQLKQAIADRIAELERLKLQRNTAIAQDSYSDRLRKPEELDEPELGGTLQENADKFAAAKASIVSIMENGSKESGQNLSEAVQQTLQYARAAGLSSRIRSCEFKHSDAELSSADHALLPLALAVPQIKKLMAVRREYAPRLEKILEERPGLNFKTMTALLRQTSPVTEGSIQGMRALFLRVRDASQVTEAVEGLKQNLRAEQRLYAEMEYITIEKVLSPRQSGTLIRSGYPQAFDSICFTDAVAARFQHLKIQET